MKAIVLGMLLSFSVWALEFRTAKIQVGNVSLQVEIADTDRHRQQGLMHRQKLPDDQGMLFIFDSEQRLSFWMKNTLIPLSIGFFDKNKKLLEVLDMEPASVMELNPKTYVSKKPALYALEVNKGWFKKHKITAGQILVLPKDF